jgi:hypothetical protein
VCEGVDKLYNNFSYKIFKKKLIVGATTPTSLNKASPLYTFHIHFYTTKFQIHH